MSSPRTCEEAGIIGGFASALLRSAKVRNIPDAGRIWSDLPGNAIDQEKERVLSNPYGAPQSAVEDVFSGENNSGGGSAITPPPGVAGWSWGAFLLNWIWAIFNQTWIGLLALVPYVGFIASIYLGIKGRELAWRNKRWNSLEHFNEVQRKWSMWGATIFFGIIGLGIAMAIIIPIIAGDPGLAEAP